MNTPHIQCNDNDISETVLLPGDPLRVKFIAENYLQDAFCYNRIRGMFGYTGYYKGKKISVQSTGMGIPSSLIYINELIRFAGAKRLIRVGTAGSMQKDVHVRDVIVAQSACTTSSLNRERFMGYDFAPTADFSLLMHAHKASKVIDLQGASIHYGPVLTMDELYGRDNTCSALKEDSLRMLYAQYGVLCSEMEVAGLYTIAPSLGCKALAILTVSDGFGGKSSLTPEQTETTLDTMIKFALEVSVDEE